TCKITRDMLKKSKMGWAHVDVLLTTGGASRMPMVRDSLKSLSGRTLNTTLSPDHSISHGAAFYAGMLLSQSRVSKSILTRKASDRLASVKQQSVNARGLGILVRDKSGKRVPYYLIPPNTTLPVAKVQTFGTVKPNQQRVHLQIVESGTSEEKPHVKIGDCVVRNLPKNLPEFSEIEVTIQYDNQARIHVSAKDVTSGLQAETEIIRQENLVSQLEQKVEAQREKQSKRKTEAGKNTYVAASQSSTDSESDVTAPTLDDAIEPIPLCNACGDPLDHRGRCEVCKTDESQPISQSRRKKTPRGTKPAKKSDKRQTRPQNRPTQPKSQPKQDDDDEFLKYFQ
ncbi:MAG: Hsp70 family protein, partial [Planctomycetaceae bacterium]